MKLRVAYARVTEIYQDKATGKNINRAGLQLFKSALKTDDTLVITLNWIGLPEMLRRAYSL